MLRSEEQYYVSDKSMARGVAGYNYVRRVRAGKGGGGYEYGGDVGTGD